MFQFVELLRTILVSSCGLKKSHYNVRVSLHEAPTKNENVTQSVKKIQSVSPFRLFLCFETKKTTPKKTTTIETIPSRIT